LLAQLPEQRCNAIHGDTDSEHVFNYLRNLQAPAPDRALLDVLRDGLRQIVEWCREIAPAAGVGLNVILTDGEEMVGSRLGRTLYYVEREGVHDCEICGFPHIHQDPHCRYRAVVAASEPISHEDWREVPERSVYRVSEQFRLESEPL
jgi:predicted glutamine amidotransferase